MSRRNTKPPVASELAVPVPAEDPREALDVSEPPTWKGEGPCPVCGKVTFAIIHSCKGIRPVPVASTDAPRRTTLQNEDWAMPGKLCSTPFGPGVIEGLLFDESGAEYWAVRAKAGNVVNFRPDELAPSDAPEATDYA
jgi:hypothetical protein